jgi:hypothetical protein
MAQAQRLARQPAITSPQAQFGHNIGDDYFLANYTQMLDYWRKLDRESDRMRIVRIGTSAEGRPIWMAIVTAGAGGESHRRAGPRTGRGRESRRLD